MPDMVLLNLTITMVITMSRKSYSELIKLETFEERFKYLKLEGRVGEETFGYDRIINQMLYGSTKWRRTRDRVIIRDNGCDLGVEGYDIPGRVTVHHINPVTVDAILKEAPEVFDLDNLISTSHNTHNAIHYSDDSILVKNPVQRSKNDTCPWKK